MNRNKPRDWNLRFMFGCLLVALMVGILAVKFWIWSVEERLDDNLEIHRANGDVLEYHERRLRVVEYTAWAAADRKRER